MPGNYDHPPASAHTHVPDVSARLQHLRELLDSDRARDQDQRRQALETLDRELSEMSAEPMSARMDRRRRGLEAQVQNNPPMRVSSPDPDTIPINHTSSLMRTRRRPTRPSDRLQRHINQFAQIERSAGRSLATSFPNDHASPLPDPPQLPRLSMSSPDSALRESPTEALINSEYRARVKRRKLDTDANHSKPFNYDHFGEVVPGALRMRLASCDGGRYDGNENEPEFILTDDPSYVYSTKNNRANILIRHFDNSPFSLTKLVIKAPQNGYDAGIQQGMVFVSMGADDLIDRTDVYKIKYTPRLQRARHTEPPGIRPSPSQDYLNPVRSPLQSLSHSFVNGPSASIRSQQESQGRTGITADSVNHPHHGPPLVPGFRVTNEYDEKNDEGNLPPNHQSSFGSTADSNPLDYNTYIYRSAQFSSSDSSSDGDEDEEWLNQRHDLEMNGLYPARTPSRGPTRYRDHRRVMPNQIELGAELESNGAEMDGKSEEAMEAMLPHAKFFIPREKYMASINFDPPVSGKYILIKLWAANPSANIDIQSIVAHGYAGPRFFPALEMR